MGTLPLALGCLLAHSQELPLPIAPPQPEDPPQVTLAWDKSPSDGVTNYIVLTGTNSGTYWKRESAGDVDTLTTTNVFNQATNYFVVLAENDKGIQSLPSNEVSAFLPLERPSAPTIRDVVIELKVYARSSEDGEWLMIRNFGPMVAHNEGEEYQFFKAVLEPSPIGRLR